jgi:hypothetical protein
VSRSSHAASPALAWSALVQFFFEDSPFSHDSDWESIIEDDDVNDILLMMVPIKNLHVEVHRRRKQR